MSITQKEFGKTEAGTVVAFTLDNGRGLQAEILNRGGIIRRLIFNGTDVVLGRETLDAYQNGSGYFGALIGRNSNRIEDCKFEINGKTYEVAENEVGKNNNLHGGFCGFDKKIWTAKMVDDEEPQLVLSTVSPDGEEGFPGNVSVKVTYTLTKENSIKIHYEGKTDSDTVLNMTNHSYFNLNGHASGDMKNHTLKLACSFYTPNTKTCVPYGEILSVAGTPFDFTAGKKVGEEIHSDYPQLKMFGGYDHNMVIDGKGFRKFAELEGDLTGIVMESFTDLPGVQLYTGNHVNAKTPCKDGAEYAPYQALCLETQDFPNSLKYSHYPSPILKKGEKYDTTTEYKFSQKK